jgi:hypothetical protein
MRLHELMFSSDETNFELAMALANCISEEEFRDELREIYRIAREELRNADEKRNIHWNRFVSVVYKPLNQSYIYFQSLDPYMFFRMYKHTIHHVDLCCNHYERDKFVLKLEDFTKEMFVKILMEGDNNPMKPENIIK